MGKNTKPRDHGRCYRLFLQAELAEVHKARELVEQVAGDAGLSEERTFAAKVAVSEACANGIEHAHSEIALVAWLLDDRILFEVTNDGTFLPGLSSDTEKRRRGLGLPLMAALADQIHISRLSASLTRVSLTFFLAPNSMEWQSRVPEALLEVAVCGSTEGMQSPPSTICVDDAAFLLESVAAASTLSKACSALLDGACGITGCEGGMVRLRESVAQETGWLPAVVHRGLPASFLREEALIRSDECMCGRVCMSLTDPALPFFTPGASFVWGRAQEIARQFPPSVLGEVRGRCIAQGYQSVAVFPLASKVNPIGILHLVDFKKENFRSTAHTLEWACRVSGIIMTKSGRRARAATVRQALQALQNA